MDPTFVIPALFALALALTFLVMAGALTRSDRLRVTCPDNGRRVDVKLDGTRALAVLATGDRQRVVACERWPAKADCDRACETHIAP